MRLRLLSKQKAAAVGGAILIVIDAVAAAGRAVTPADPLRVSPAEALSPPSLAHPFGTDQYGRDVVSRVIAGAGLSLTTGLGAVAIAVAGGLFLGLVSGAAGGWPDLLIMRVIEVMMAFPSVLLACGATCSSSPRTRSSRPPLGGGQSRVTLRHILLPRQGHAIVHGFCAVHAGYVATAAARRAGAAAVVSLRGGPRPQGEPDHQRHADRPRAGAAAGRPRRQQRLVPEMAAAPRGASPARAWRSEPASPDTDYASRLRYCATKSVPTSWT
jgi:hypothetical protein